MSGLSAGADGPPERAGLMNADELANLLGVTSGWVYDQSRRGLIPTVRLGRYYRYRYESILAWVEERERAQ